jgi:hypothetical protein
LPKMHLDFGIFRLLKNPALCYWWSPSFWKILFGCKSIFQDSVFLLSSITKFCSFI